MGLWQFCYGTCQAIFAKANRKTSSQWTYIIKYEICLTKDKGIDTDCVENDLRNTYNLRVLSSPSSVKENSDVCLYVYKSLSLILIGHRQSAMGFVGNHCVTRSITIAKCRWLICRPECFFRNRIYGLIKCMSLDLKIIFIASKDI